MARNLAVVLLAVLLAAMAFQAEAKATGGSLACGRKLIQFLFAICPDGCEADLDEVITSLCHTAFSMEEIQNKCCPTQ